MAASLYKQTATPAIRNGRRTGEIYAFGREAALRGQPADRGGYAVFVLQPNYAGHVRGGVAKTWRLDQQGLSWLDAIRLINKRVGFKAFDETRP